MKRYAVTVDLYIYADNDNEVKEKAKKFVEDVQFLVDETENNARVVSIHNAPFAKLGNLKELR